MTASAERIAALERIFGLIKNHGAHNKYVRAMKAVLDTSITLTPEDANRIMLAASLAPDMRTLSILESIGICALSAKEGVIYKAATRSASVAYIQRLSDLGFSWSNVHYAQGVISLAISTNRPEYILPALKAGVPAFHKGVNSNPLRDLAIKCTFGGGGPEWITEAGYLLAFGGRFDECQMEWERPHMENYQRECGPFIEAAKRAAAAYKLGQEATPSSSQSTRPRL